ncbi:MAG: polyphosphate kinase 1 [Myxococcota bacterium]
MRRDRLPHDASRVPDPRNAEQTRSPDGHPAFPEARYFNRELTWLDFNERVLALAEDPSLALLERVKFLAIASRNLDHFFQVRVAGLKAQVEADVGARSIDGRSPEEQLAAIRPRIVAQMERQDDCFGKELLPRLRDIGVRLCTWDELDAKRQSALSAWFEHRVFPVLTPLSVDPSHPFPYISNLSLNLAVVVRDPGNQALRFARVKVPPLFPRWIPLPDEPDHRIPIEQLIAAHVTLLFPGMEIASCTPFRLTRDAELALDENDAEDLLQAVESGLKRRLRMNAAVRLEAPWQMSDRILDLLRAELELGADDVFMTRELLDLGSLWEIHGIDRPAAKRAPHVPVTPPAFEGIEDGDGGLFDAMHRADVLVHHPYESFRDSFEAFLTQAAEDPDVLAIKHTLYRTAGGGAAGSESSIIRTLIDAAEAGKQVVTLVELTARFDEQANIRWARALEEAGVHVVYGVVGLKSHCKVTLVVRNESDGIRRYVHIGTGNYNPQTARSYEDFGLFSCSGPLAADATDLFNSLTGCSKQTDYRKLLVAPTTLRRTLLEEIEREKQAPDGRIVIKANGLADRALIDALYEASRAGTQIDLIVRGVCCLRPGVPGLSENIRVRSLVGPFLEHSRIFRFGSSPERTRLYLGSADLMPRNLDGRVEAVVPIESREGIERVDEVLELCIADDALAWELGADGTWTRADRGLGLSAQDELVLRARERSHSAIEQRLRRAPGPYGI